MDIRPIGLFDSGLGGLTAVKELEKLMPHEQIVYFGDTGRVPYGTRGSEIIKKYAMQDIRFLKSFGVKAILIACGTVSSVAYDEAKAEAGLPVIGVVEPAAAAAAKRTKSRHIGVVGTGATINSGAYERALRALLPDAQIISRACPLFVPLVENGCFGRENRLARIAAEEYLADLNGVIDTLILGCTHYPLLRSVIAELLPGVELIDAGAETAKAVATLMERNDMLSDDGGKTRFYVSDSANFERLAGIFLEKPVYGRVEKVDIEKY